MRENFVVHPKYVSVSPELKKVLKNFSTTGENITKGERNEIKKVEIGGEVLNIKKFKTPNAFQGLVYQFLRKSKARRSFENANKLLKLDINTPFPIAYLENSSFGFKKSYYVSKHVDFDFDFRKLIHNPKFNNREEILKQFTKYTFQLHENNINFLDHSPGNTLIVENKNSKYDFYLIDLNRMRFETMTFEKRMNNFRRLWLSKTMIKIMAIEYAKLLGRNYEETHKSMSKFSIAFQKKANRKKLRRRKKK